MKILCLLINLIGGAAVLGSYAYGLYNYNAALLWGGLPEHMRPLYAWGMLAAMLGYLACAYVILCEVEPSRIKIFGYFSYNFFSFSYALILVCSLLWMPLTLKMALDPHNFLWLFIRVILFLVALGAFLLVLAFIYFIYSKCPLKSWARVLGLIGSALFFIHTFVLDALIWPYFFKK